MLRCAEPCLSQPAVWVSLGSGPVGPRRPRITIHFCLGENMKRMFTKAFLAAAVSLPIAATAAEYMEKTPFQLSRAFSPGVVTDGGKIVWVAGQTATRDNDGKDIANNFEAQVRQVFSQIDQIMKRAGGSVTNFARPGIEIEIQSVGVIGDRCSSASPCSAEGQAKKK